MAWSLPGAPAENDRYRHLEPRTRLGRSRGEALALVRDTVLIVIVRGSVGEVAFVGHAVFIAVVACAVGDVAFVRNVIVVAVRFAFVGYAVFIAVIAQTGGRLTIVRQAITVAVHAVLVSTHVHKECTAGCVAGILDGRIVEEAQRRRDPRGSVRRHHCPCRDWRYRRV